MKITNFKMYPLMIAVSAFLTLSGCDGTTGIISDSGIGTETPTPTPLPDAGTSTVTASPVTIAADGSETSTVTVTVNDANSDPVADATVTLSQTGSSTISAVTNVGDGTYTFMVTSTTAETVTYTATADSVVITQTVDVTFTQIPTTPTPVPDAGTSAVTASPGTVAADGSATSTVTVTVNDANSDPVADATVTLSQTGSSTISAVTNVGDGTYTFDVTSMTPETVTYTATADSVLITQTANVTFIQTDAQCLDTAGGYQAIVINGRSWLDKNLGAAIPDDGTGVDTASYGDLYQFGRTTEGHQERNSLTTTTLATSLNDNNTSTDWYGKFIVAPADWTNVDTNGTKRSASWSTPYDENSNPNQICPCGYVVPTPQDFTDLNISEFKVAFAGIRGGSNGTISLETQYAFFWTSEAKTAHRISSGGASASVPANLSDGYSIRCIKPLP